MRKLFVISFLLLSSLQSFGVVHYVKSDVIGGLNNGTSWANAFSNLQTAIDIAVSGDQIWVSQGTYLPTKDPASGPDPRDKTFWLTNGVAIYGGFAGTETAINQRVIGNTSILSGDIGTVGVNTDNCYHVVLSVSDNNTTVLDGFTISGGNANSTSVCCHTVESKTIFKTRGGGVYTNSSSVILSNLVITNNNASIVGGGMNNDASSPVILNTSFTTNTANSGGAGVYNSGSTTGTFANSKLTLNSTGGFGGGMYNNSSGPSLTDVLFLSNNGGQGGGGVYNQSSTTVLNRVVFFGNTSPSSGFGGGLYDNPSNSTITNCLFASNSAARGGGIANSAQSIATITNCTIYNNSSASVGGGGADFGGNATVKNSIFWGNLRNGSTTAINSDFQDSGFSSNGILTISYTVLQNVFNTSNYQCSISNLPSPTCPNININNNLFAQNPSFVNISNLIGIDNIWKTIDDGLALQADSPCVNFGTFTGAPSVDITGTNRVSNIDLGAYEYLSPCASILTPTGTITSNQKAANSVSTTSINTIPNASNIIYQGGNYVQLNAGFSAVNGSVFTARILGNCQ